MKNSSIRNISEYIKNIKYTIPNKYDNIITVEHRSNNPKRDYLFVNRIQGKHIPCSPSKMIDMCKDLADEVNKQQEYKNILVVGFAETATAIAHFVAKELNNCKYVMCTTREDMSSVGRQLITFEEEHSHATTQMLYTYNNECGQIDLKSIDFILFVEDEISTGNTILNFIKAFRKQNVIGDNVEFGVASICNWQDDKNRNLFKQENIKRYYLISGELKDVNAKLAISANDIITDMSNNRRLISFKPIKQLVFNTGYFNNCRLGRLPDSAILPMELLRKFTGIKNTTVRVIGTEECMAPSIELGYYLEVEKNNKVICHSTTRSKIDIMRTVGNKDSFIDSGINIPSVYEKDRDTYIYNIDNRTEYTIVVTDKDVNSKFAEHLEMLNTEWIIIVTI